MPTGAEGLCVLPSANKRAVLCRTNGTITAGKEFLPHPVSGLAASKNDQLKNEVDLDDVLFTDRNVLAIILQNLVVNAVNHTEDSTVTIHSVQHADGYRLIVSDNGPGMSPRAQRTIRSLIAGERGHENEHPPGETLPGLGYVIITELLALLRGRLDFVSTVGTGTVITLTLPALDQGPPASP